MGTFAGHAVPGSFFLVISLWWTVSIWIRFFRSRHATCLEDNSKRRRWSTSFRSQPTFPSFCCLRFPLEGSFKLVSCLIGIAGETITGFKDGNFVHMMNLQHILMFFFFGLNGAVDIMMSAGVSLPVNTDYTSMVVALLVEWLLFHFHLHGRTPLDVHVHTLLTLVVACSIVVVLFEMKYRNQALCPLLRAVVTMLQGSWFFQIGFILYNPIPGAARWSEDDHDQMMIVTALFAVHIAGALLAVTLIAAAVSWCHRKRTRKAWDGDIPFQSLTDGNEKAKAKSDGKQENEESSDF